MPVSHRSPDISGLSYYVPVCSPVTKHCHPVRRYAVFHPTPVTSPSAPRSRTSSPCFSLNARYQVSVSCKTTGNITPLYVLIFMFLNGKPETVVAGILVTVPKHRAVLRIKFVGWWYRVSVGTVDCGILGRVIFVRSTVQATVGLFRLRGCWSLHPFLGRPTFLLAVGCIRTLTWKCVYRSCLINVVFTELCNTK